MKRSYLQALPKPTDFKVEAYNLQIESVQKLFNQIVLQDNRECCQHLLQEIKRVKDIKEMKKQHRKPIYEFFLKRELQTLSYIKGEDSIDFKIMKLTKCKLQQFTIDWKDMWERIVKQVPQTNSLSSKVIENFIKHIKVFFDQNNALDVWKYFEVRDQKQFSKIISLFVRITPQTKQTIFNEFVMELVRNCQIRKLTNNQFLVLFLWVEKNRKQLSLAKEVFDYVNDLVLQFILANGSLASTKKNSVESKFDSTSAELLERSLGKANKGSIQLLKTVFSFVKKFIKPLESSTKSVMFVYWLLKNIFLRVDREKKTRERLEKLLQKMKQKKQQKDKQQQQNDDEDDDVQQQQQEHQQEQMNHLLGHDSEMNFQKDDENQKGDTDEQKKERMEKILGNEITQQILEYLKKQIQEIFEVLYFVNSKKTISHLLRYIYRLFPNFVIKSLQVLDKAADIPNISQDGLVRNLTVTVEHFFMDEHYKQGVKNVMRVLEKAYNSRRIVDVWYIYECVGSKIPLLDEKDLELIDDKDKELFEQTFGMNHDRFYQSYSDHMIEAFKRLLREGQYLEKNQHLSFATTLQLFHFNAYPFMRKRVLEEVMQVMEDKPNSLIFLFFSFGELPQKQFEILQQQFMEMNEQNTDTFDERVQMLGVLSKNMTLTQLKPYIRKMAQKGNFKLVENYGIYRIIEQIRWDPLKTTLNYLYEDPKITITFNIPIEQRKKRLQELMEYRDELIQQVSSQIDQMVQDEPQTVTQRIIKSYTTPAKILTLQRRKKIFEVLSIVAVINALMEQKLISIKNSKKLELVDSGVSPYKFLDVNKPFSKYIKKLLNIQQVLHDPKLIGILNTLLTGQYFMYHDIELYEEKRLIKQKKKNKNHETPEKANIFVFSNEYISNARKFMACYMHKTHGGANHDITGKADQLFILSMVNSNESYKDIRSMFQQSKMIPQIRQKSFELLKEKVENRDLIKRISSTIDFLTKSEVLYIPYGEQQIINFVSYHAGLMQSQDSKVKQNAIKSFRKFPKIICENPINENLAKVFLKYRNTDKMEMIWIIYVAALINHPQFTDHKEIAEKRILFLLENMQKLLLHDSRSIRRICLYVYSALIRTLKKLNAVYLTKNFEGVQEQKSLEKFVETGFLRAQFESIDLKDKESHKNHQYDTYEVKTPFKVPSHLFDSLIQNSENAMKFIVNYHSDSASTAQMMISALQNSMTAVDLYGIATKAVEKIVYCFKTKDLAISRNEMIVGGKFFKYLCIEDANRGYKFFHSIKEFILSCLSNLQSLDNQTLVILYAYSLMSAYDTTFTNRDKQIEQFLTKIFKEIIKKSSKSIYTKLQTLFFKKIKNRQSVVFVQQMCEDMIKDSNKVFRVGYLLSVLQGKNFYTSQKILRKMFDQRIQLEHENNILNSIYGLLIYPQHSMWSLEEVERSKIIDVQKLKRQGKIKETLHSYLILSIKDLQDYLIKSIRSMLLDGSIEVSKTSFTLLNSTIKCCSQLYFLQENSQFTVELLKMWLKMLTQKRELQLDFESGYKAIGHLFGVKLLPKETFERYLLTILENLETNKKSCDLLISILNSPINYIGISNQLFKSFTKTVLSMQSNSSLYKQILQILSTFFRFKILTLNELSEIEKQHKGRRALLLQAYLLAENIELKPDIVKEVLKISTKERKIIWARQMMFARGQREHFDNLQTHEVWKQIKSLSNPYHYHA